MPIKKDSCVSCQLDHQRSFSLKLDIMVFLDNGRVLEKKLFIREKAFRIHEHIPSKKHWP